MVFNVVVYAVQAVLWVLAGLAHSNGTLALLRVISSAFIAVVSISAAIGFLLYGGRLFLMLRRCGLPSTEAKDVRSSVLHGFVACQAGRRRCY